MSDYFGFDGVDDADLRREKAKARELRRTRWWQQKLAAGLCHYCHRRVPREELTMDHLLPLARGGRSTKNNLVPCCKDCNNRKKSMLPLEWEEYLQGGGTPPPEQAG
ncbi:MAG: HNH endonuclease [Desulfobulbaceae bacterium]|nr:MAG: HNH endonuclease [Desulfobulbaceae bacterium]